MINIERSIGPMPELIDGLLRKMASNKEAQEPVLKIPEGINYECTGCGKCCSGWSVPLTEADYKRIASIDWGKLNADLVDRTLFRSLKPAERCDTPYTHAIVANEKGQCPFLKDNLCFIHSQFGAATKPAICQLFPYSFNETPDGIYTTVSFISRGALLNSGKALSEQKDYLLGKYNEFRKLFPEHHPNWSQIRLGANSPLMWKEYLEIEKIILGEIKNNSESLEERLLKIAIYLDSLLRKNAGQVVSVKQGLNYWDEVLLCTLYKAYFKESEQKVKSYGQQSLSLFSFLFTAIREKISADIKLNNYLLTDLIAQPWPENAEINDLIYRFFYSRIFAKMYFGAGFGQLSLIAGFNHLIATLVLIKLHAKVLSRQAGRDGVELIDVMDTVVQLEKSLGEVKLSPYGAAILELLLSSPIRVQRLLYC